MTLQSEDGYKILSVGPGWEHVLGWTSDEMIHQRLDFFLHPQDKHLNGSIGDFSTRWRRKPPGRWAWLRWRTAESPWHVGVIFANAQDETAQMDHMRTLSAWAEITSDLMLVADASQPPAERKPRWVNPAWTRLLGWSSTELCDMRLIDLLAPSDVPKAVQNRLEHEEKSGGEGEVRSAVYKVRCKPAQGQDKPVYKTFLWKIQILEGRIYVTGQDISHELVHESDMQRAFENLQGRNQDLERFANVAAHQLRAPPRTIAGLAMILLEDYGHLLDDEGRECLRDIRQETDQMGEIVDGLYRFSHVRTSEGLTLVPVDLNNVMQSVRRALDRKICPQCSTPQQCQTQKARECPLQALRLHVQRMPIVMGDRTLLQEVFANLVDNGFKFNESPKKVVHITWEARPDNRVSITVSDNGLGIDEKYQGKLFTMFQRMHQAYAGTGVGLALVAAIIQKMGGAISVKSSPGQGSSFTFDLQGAKNLDAEAPV
jgi:signal transduction histidine kinase